MFPSDARIRIRLVLPDPTHYVHAHAFDEIVLALLAGLKRRAVEVELTRRCEQGEERVMVLAPHLHSLEALGGLRRDSILYTWEPLGWDHVVVMTSDLVGLMSEFVIWDYSANNVMRWRRLGASRVVHVPMAYDRILERIPKRHADPPVDVLFYGSVNERRRKILGELADRGLRVKHLFGVYGRERDAWIASSRVVLNMHVHDGHILELPRLVYLWANRVPTVTELAADTEDVYTMAREMIHAPYERLADCVVEAVHSVQQLSTATEGVYQRLVALPHSADVIEQAFEAELAWGDSNAASVTDSKND